MRNAQLPGQLCTSTAASGQSLQIVAMQSIWTFSCKLLNVRSGAQPLSHEPRAAAVVREVCVSVAMLNGDRWVPFEDSRGVTARDQAVGRSGLQGRLQHTCGCCSSVLRQRFALRLRLIMTFIGSLL